jgi:hypothetical protein
VIPSAHEYETLELEGDLQECHDYDWNECKLGSGIHLKMEGEPDGHYGENQISEYFKPAVDIRNQNNDVDADASACSGFGPEVGDRGTLQKCNEEEAGAS